MLLTTPKKVWTAGTERERAIRTLLQQDGPLAQRVRAAADQMKVSERIVSRWLARFVETEQTTSVVHRGGGR